LVSSADDGAHRKLPPTLTLPRSRGREGRGLAACFYNRDIGRIWRVAEGLEYGIAGINEGIISIEIAPLGGTS
jgi:acyl-CoA reductase-like NAD-dependent aldehyde dehydrogenase